jgi:hypothetical protein
MLGRYMNPKAALGVFALLLMLAANVGLRQANVRGQNAEVPGLPPKMPECNSYLPALIDDQRH